MFWTEKWQDFSYVLKAPYWPGIGNRLQGARRKAESQPGGYCNHLSGCLHQDGDSEESGKRLHFLKTESAGFANGLDVELRKGEKSQV